MERSDQQGRVFHARTARRVLAFVVFGLAPLALLMAPGASAAAYSATANVTPQSHFLNDAAGTMFRFTVNNTGTTASIGAVEIARPSTAWTVTACPVAPFGWTAQRSDSMCRYRSKAAASDDIKPGKSSQFFAVRATSGPGTQDRTGAWKVTVSRTNHFSTPSALTTAPAPTAGALHVTAHSFQVLDAGMAAAPATPGSPCPTLTRQAVTASTQDVVVCGRNRTTATLTPTAAESSLAGTWIGTAGAFASGPVAPSTSSVVLGTWNDTVLTNVFGPGKTVVAEIGSAANRTSPAATLVGYDATNRTPVPLAGSATTLEDTVSGPITLSATDDDGNASLFNIHDAPAHGTLGAIGAVTCTNTTPNTCTADVVYTPDADYAGSDSFTYTASDDFATSAPVTVELTVTPVNDAPSFTKGADQAVNEDSGAQTVNGWATAISTGPAEADQAITSATVTNDNNGLFSAQPAVDAAGNLTYTPAPNANGFAIVSVSITDDGGTANGGADTSDIKAFLIEVAAVNDEPSFTKGADQTVWEDSGTEAVDGWATGMSVGPADEAGQGFEFSVTNDNNDLFAVQPDVDESTGRLSYIVDSDKHGSATVTVTMTDDGGTANGGDNAVSQTFAITVTPINDTPSFNGGGAQTVNEDSGAQTVNGWATDISSGPEESQTLTFSVSANKPSLFSAQPAIDSTGTLTYTPAPDANGTAIVNAVLYDDGGEENGGDDSSKPEVFTITVNAVNDAPSFTKGADQTVNEDSGAQSVNGWASAISKGPADESGQTLAFFSSNDNNDLFSVQPGLTPTGELVYTPAANRFGSAMVSVYLTDDGGTANGGDDTSDSQTFTITVSNVNDAPSFTKGADQTVNEDSGAQTVNGWATSISPGPFESDKVSLSITANDSPTLFSAGPALSDSGTLTYTPAADAFGVANLTATADDGNGGTASHTFTITVTGVNDSPSFTGGGNRTVNEDSGAQTVSGWATAISAGPNETGTLTFEFTGNDNSGLFSAAPAVDPSTGNLTFTPAANTSGTANLTLVLKDDAGAASSPYGFSISVTAINDEPSFTKGANLTVAIDSGPQTFPAWATNISAGPNETQTLTFQTFQENGGFFAANGDPAIDPATGNLTFTPGSTLGTELVYIRLTDNGGTADGGDDTFALQTLQIDFVPPNFAPVAQAASGSGNEDGGAITVTLTGTDDDDDNLTFSVGTAENGLVSVPGTVDCTTVAETCTATVTYTPNQHFHGQDTFSYTVNDGTVDSAPATATVTVNSVNDRPSFTKGADQAVNEDSGAQTVNGWATNVSPGPANESEQTVTIQRVNTTNNALFSALPSVDAATGDLTYTPAANAHGIATVSLKAVDNGTTDNGGVKEGDVVAFNITVNSVNDVPVASDDGATTDEDTFVNVSALANDTDADNDTLLFDAFDSTSAEGAAISDNGDGTLKYDPAGQFDDLQVDEANVTDTFSYTVKDGNGGTDTATVTITITPVNDPPVAASESQTGVIGNTLHSVSTTSTGPHTTGTGQLDDGVVDPDDTVFTVTAGAVSSANSGTATIAPDGSYTFLPPQGHTGTDTFSFTVNDAHGGSDTETATMTIGEMVWYVDNSKVAAGDGRSSSPFNTIAPLSTGGSADAKDNADDYIFLYQGSGAYTGGLVLEGTQRLWGQPKGLTVASTALVTAGGSNPTLNGGVTLANNTDLQALDLGAATMALSGTSVGTSTVGTTHSVNVNNPSGGGVSLNGGTPTVTVAKLTTSGGTHGISLTSLGGAVTVNDATSSITSPTTAGVAVSSGAGTLTYPGSISAGGSARSVSVASKTGGSVSLSGAVTDSGTGISLTNNGGASVALSGELTLSTTSNAAFTATGGGTVTATHNDNEITTTSGTGVNIANTTIGSGHVKFESVNVNAAGTASPVNGIVVNTTGSSGSFQVSGSGTTASGGVIRGTSGVGISLTSTSAPSLTRMRVQDTGSHGIQGSSLSGLTLNTMEVPGAGNADNERAVDLTNVSGTLNISGGSYSDASDDLVKLVNTSTNATVSVLNGAEFKDLTQATANNAIQIVPDGTSAITASVNGSTFSNLKNSSLHFGASAASSSGSSSVSFTNNTVNGGAQGGAGLVVGGQENTTTTATITGNTFTGAGGDGVVNHDTNDNANLNSTIMNNVFTSPKGHAIVGGVDENGDTRLRIENNNISNAGGDGILLSNFGDDSANAMTSTANFIVRGNTVNGHSQTAATQNVGAIGIFHFEDDTDTTCAAVTNNIVQNTPMGFLDIYLQDYSVTPSRLKFEENPNTVNSGQVAESYIAALNPQTTLLNIANSGAVYGDATLCQAP